MLKPVPPVPSDSFLYIPAMFVKSVPTQTQEEISKSMHVQFYYELFQVITFKQAMWDRDVFRALVARRSNAAGMGGSHCPPASQSPWRGGLDVLGMWLALSALSTPCLKFA